MNLKRRIETLTYDLDLSQLVRYNCRISREGLKLKQYSNRDNVVIPLRNLKRRIETFSAGEKCVWWSDTFDAESQEKDWN